ncbi:MAG: acyl carrier protein [Alphaproteobacteria bacterium]
MQFPRPSPGKLKDTKGHYAVVDALRERIIATIQRVLGPEANVEATRLELSSLKMLELVVALEEEFGIEISDDAPLGYVTSSVDSIAKYLRETASL